jgi:Putative metallopeptidase
LGDYQKNPVIQTRLAAFATDHGLPQERFYNLVCLAFGGNSQELADFASFLPPTRAPNCSHEYQTLLRAFRHEIRPHLDMQAGARVVILPKADMSGSGSLPCKLTSEPYFGSALALRLHADD